MNNKTYVYTYLFTLIGGVLLLVLHSRADLFDGIAIIIGIVFLVLGILNLVGNLFISSEARAAGVRRSPSLIFVSAGAFILGLLMVIVPHFFVAYLVYMFGIILIVCGVMQVMNFTPNRRSLGFSFWWFSTPVLSIIAGVVVICLGADRILNILAILTGIVLIVYSLNGFLGYFSRARLIRRGGRTSHVVEIE